MNKSYLLTLCFRSPGFGLTLVAETTEGGFFAAEAVSNPKGSDKGPTVPEDLGKQAAIYLLEEVYKVCCVNCFIIQLSVFKIDPNYSFVSFWIWAPL